MRNLVLFIALLMLLVCAARSTSAQNSEWRPVSGSRRDNLSGMALVEYDANVKVFIVVNDNKKKADNHAAILTIENRNAPKYAPLKWLGEDVGTDLEAIAAVPGAKNNFTAFTSAGRVFQIELDRPNNSVKVLKSFDVPNIPADPNFEGFALQTINGTLLAVWADRGSDTKPAQLFWAKLDLPTKTFTQINSAFLKVPYPIGSTRHISDVKIDESGAVFIASASDPGNDGPFASAVYFAGTFNLCGSSPISFAQSPALVRLFKFDYHKIEALELVPGTNGGMIFGTDDENLGSAIYTNW